jgi:hypothetical protein
MPQQPMLVPQAVHASNAATAPELGIVASPFH